MAFNILGALGQGALGLLTGGPIGGLAGAAVGGFGSGSSTNIAGNGINSIIQSIDTGAELDQAANYAEQARHNSVMQWESTDFNEMLDQRSEVMRETNDLRTLAMEQRKADNEVTKEFIKSIHE